MIGKFLELAFDNGALFLDHQHRGVAARELTQRAGIDGPQQARLAQAKPQRLPFVRVVLVRDGPLAVEPVLDARALDDDSRRAMDMINELGVSFPVLFDSTKEVSRMYDVDAMPVTVIVDREGNVRHVHQGYKPGYELKYLDEVRALLRE